MATYVRGDELNGFVQTVMDKHHPQLQASDVSVQVMLAFAKVKKNGEKEGPAVTHNGHAAAAKIRICSLKERVQGLGDAELTIDGDRWGDFTEAQQEALLDHELTHLEIQTDKGGGVKFDEIDRPKLKIRPHDWQIGGFDVIAHRHGNNALEVTEMRKVTEEHRQLFLPFDQQAAA